MSSLKKAARKIAARHAHPDEHEGNLRRVYEHLGRVAVLTGLAEQELASGHMKYAADLLRAAEHLSFGVLNFAQGASGVPSPGSFTCFQSNVTCHGRGRVGTQAGPDRFGKKCQ